MVRKGRVSTISSGGDTVTATPYTGEIVTGPLIVPCYLVGLLSVGDPIIYTMFDDGTGIVLHKEDGTGKSGGSNLVAVIEDNILKIIAKEG